MTREDFEKVVKAQGIGAAYGAACGAPSWGDKLVLYIPDHMQKSVAEYILFGGITGDFLLRVVSGNLFGAYQYADGINEHRLRDYVMFFYNAAPTGCYGTEEAASNWMNRKGLIGRVEAPK